MTISPGTKLLFQGRVMTVLRKSQTEGHYIVAVSPTLFELELPETQVAQNIAFNNDKLHPRFKPKKQKPYSGKFTPEQQEFIKNNLHISYQELAKTLGKSSKTINTFVRNKGWSKTDARLSQKPKAPKKTKHPIPPKPQTAQKPALPPEVSRLCAATGFPTEQITHGGKQRELSDARAFVWYFIYSKTDLSFAEIGRLTNKHHSTVMRGIGRISTALRENEQPLANLYAQFLINLTS